MKIKISLLKLRALKKQPSAHNLKGGGGGGGGVRRQVQCYDHLVLLGGGGYNSCA